MTTRGKFPKGKGERKFHPVVEVYVTKMNNEYEVHVTREGRKPRMYRRVRSCMFGLQALDRMLTGDLHGIHISARLMVFPEIWYRFPVPCGGRRPQASPAKRDSRKAWITRPVPEYETRKFNGED